MIRSTEKIIDWIDDCRGYSQFEITGILTTALLELNERGEVAYVDMIIRDLCWETHTISCNPDTKSTIIKGKSYTASIAPTEKGGVEVIIFCNQAKDLLKWQIDYSAEEYISMGI